MVFRSFVSQPLQECFSNSRMKRDFFFGALNMVKTKPAVQKDKAKILIVEDHPAAREGLAMRIASQPDLTVCGEAADLAEALQLIAATDPDVVIVDISLKSGNGIDLIKR